MAFTLLVTLLSLQWMLVSVGATRVKVLEDSEGKIRSPGWYEEGYSNNEDISWMIKASPGKVVEVTFTKMDLQEADAEGQCSRDSVTLWDESSEDPLATYCGQLNELVTVLSRSDWVTVAFKTDNKVTAQGFKLQWRVVKSRGCGLTFKEPMGKMHSPGYNGGGYKDHMDCHWVIITDPGKVISLTFTDMNLEETDENGRCSRDNVTIWDENSTKALATYCGHSSTPIKFTSANHWVMIVLKSDISISGQGFKMTWKRVYRKFKNA